MLVQGIAQGLIDNIIWHLTFILVNYTLARTAYWWSDYEVFHEVVNIIEDVANNLLWSQREGRAIKTTKGADVKCFLK